MHGRSLRTIAALVTTLSLLFSLSGTALAVDPTELSATALEPDGAPITAAKSRSGALAETDPDLLGRTDTAPVAVFIKLDYDAVASYAGGVEGLAPTSPEVTGKSLEDNEAAVDAYKNHLSKKEAEAREAIEAAVPTSTVLDSYQVAYGGLSGVVPANRIAELAAVDGVVAVQEDKLAQPLTDATPEFIGATAAWAQISDSTTAGEGVIVGVLDTGIWPEHPSLADNGIDHPGGTYECDFGDGTDPDLGDPFTCNDKLIGAYSFVDTYLDFGPDPLEGEFCNDAQTDCSARDANGHGTHTATTAAGSAVEEAVLLGVDQGPLSGIAPGAHVIAYRVCLNEGCFQSDSVAAVEQAIADGVDVLNFSISGGVNAYTDAVELAFLDAYAAGILVNASAGNAGPGAGTANHAGPWTNTVGASTSDRHFLTTLELAGEGANGLDIVGATVTAGVDVPAEVVLAENVPGYTDPLCQTPLPADSAAGLVVACERGVIARVDKSKHVEPSGAAGMILYNPTPQGLNTDNHFIPSVHIDQPDSDAFLAFMADNETVLARWDPGTKTEVQGDVMASFSSRGPLGDFLKPDVTAPGVQILAGNTPVPVGDGTGVIGQLYQAIQGTSMSSPHAAGVSALVKAAHPDWTPGQIKSALMTTSVQDVLKEDGATPADPFDRGAGSIRADNALNPPATIDVDAADYYASAGDPLGRLNLNLPSVYANPMPGAIETTRTLTNVTDRDQPFTVDTDTPAGVNIGVSPRQGSVPAGGSIELTIVLSAPSVPDGTYFGQINFDFRHGQDLVVPVAFQKAQAPLTLDHTCDPTTIARNTAADCQVTVQNFAPVEADAQLSLTAPNPGRVRIENVSPPGVPGGNGFTWSGTLSPALPPTVDSIEAGGSPFGYFALSNFASITPIGGMGDETIVNFNVPTYQFGSETYTRIGLTSNGYAVLGGGTGADVDFVPQTLPDPSRPNNVLAPFWTDLDFTKGGELRLGILSSGGTRWLVADWEDVATWTDPGTTNSFQIWIELGATEDITYTYGPTVDGPDPVGLTVGAENRDGTSGVNLGSTPAAGSDYEIFTSPPTAGGSVTITYDAFGRRPGTYDLVASLTSSLFNGTTQKVVTLTVE